jgi:hypothetical protein
VNDFKIRFFDCSSDLRRAAQRVSADGLFLESALRKATRARQRERPDDPAWSETLACADAPCAGTGRSRDRPFGNRRRSASGRRGAVADDARSREVRLCHSSWEADEQSGPDGTVTLPNRARNKSAGMLGSCRSDDVAPGLHRRGPEGSVRFCGGEMALDVESVVSGCVG